METTTHTIESLSASIAELPTHAFPKIVKAIAKKSKQKAITSGSLSFKGYCEVIAKALLKPSNEEILNEVKRIYSFAF